MPQPVRAVVAGSESLATPSISSIGVNLVNLLLTSCQCHKILPCVSNSRLFICKQGLVSELALIDVGVHHNLDGNLDER